MLPTKWALGYSVGRLGSQDSTSAFGIGGSGGSFAYGDHAKGVSCAVTKNLLTPDQVPAIQAYVLSRSRTGEAPFMIVRLRCSPFRRGLS